MNKFMLKEICFAFCLFGATCALYILGKQFAYYQVLLDNNLSQTTITLLSSFDKPISITLYSQNQETHQNAKILIESYQHLQPLIHFEWKQSTPQTTKLPNQALIIRFAQSEQVIDLEKNNLNENVLSNALFKLQRQPNEWVVMLQGHGEPSPHGTLMRDFNLFRQALENQGLKIQALNLLQTPFIPDNTSVLIIASPQSAFMPIEEKLILDYLAKGKDLLWLSDPNDYPLDALSDYLGIVKLEGTIADKHGHQLGTPHPAITIIEKYNSLPFEEPRSLTAFPFARALSLKEKENYTYHAFLKSHEQSWTEKDINNKALSFNPENGEIAGPLTLGYILTKPYSNSQQRVIVIGNSRFLSNGAIENYGNLGLGLNLVSWLHHDDQLLHISQPTVKDSMLHLPYACVIAITYGFPLLSLALCFCAILLFNLRKKQSNQSQSQNPSRFNSH